MKPWMFSSEVEFDGILLKVDPINRPRTDEDDNVMAIFQEEQPFTWDWVKPKVKETLGYCNGAIDFLDVGTGSGVFGILMAKEFGANVLAIDKSIRSIAFANENAIKNGVKISFKHCKYNKKLLPARSCKMIGLYPPYHIYPPNVESLVPQHARGGSDGQAEFRNQLKIAGYHIAQNGIIFFNMMCLGDKNGPEFLRYIPKYVEKASILYTNVFESIRTEDFLDAVYDGMQIPHDYIKKVSFSHPFLYYAVGIIINDSNGRVECMRHNIELKDRSWKDRILLHREIALHQLKQKF